MKNKEYVKRLVRIAKSRDANYFVEFAKVVPLTQEQYDDFWKMVREEQKTEEELHHERWEKAVRESAKKSKEEDTVECMIFGKERRLTEDEFAFVRDWLGEPIEISNCCGFEITEPTQDNTARCPRCYEGCEIVYVWGE